MAVDYNDLLYEKAQKEYDDLIAELKKATDFSLIRKAKRTPQGSSALRRYR